jgi:hypothetical protein
MHFEFLLEEESAERVLDNLLPKIIMGEHTYRCIRFQGKKDLLNKLPLELKGYAKWIPIDYRIVVLVDRDRAECIELKNSLNKIAKTAGLKVKTGTDAGSFQVLNRVAVEEIEAWFFGDADAMRLAYPKLTENFEMKAKYRIPDSIQNTWESMESLLQRGGYFKTGLRKTEAAYEISKNMEPLKNRSKSFQVFWQGISDCLQDEN